MRKNAPINLKELSLIITMELQYLEQVYLLKT